MNKTFFVRSGATAAALAVVLALTPAMSFAGQRRGGGGDRSGGGAGGGSRGGGGGGGTGTAVPRGGGGGGGDTSRGGGRTTASPGPRDGSSGRDGSGDETARGRDRGDEPVVGQAVPRTGGGYRGGGTTVIVPGGYWGGWAPWGYGGFGFAGYYGGYWDPYFYGGPGYYGYGGLDGALRLKVTPRDASVFVDGYYAGEVDQFDGVFQRLRLEPGPHRIEINADGYEPLSFEVRVLPDRTTTFKGELVRQ